MSNQYKNQWTADEICFLKENYMIMDARTLSSIMGRSQTSIFVKASKIGLHKETSRVKSHHFLKLIDPRVSYILGYLWADGSIRNKTRSIKLKIKKDDYHKIKPTLFFIGKWSETEIRPKSVRHSPKVEARFNNRMIYDFLVANDYREKSISSPSKILKHIPSYLHSYFFRGFFDGDGCVQRYTISITGHYEQDWASISTLLTSLGIKFRIIKQINKKRKSKCSRIEIYGKENMTKFLSYIYNNRENDKIGLDRKFQKYIDYFQC